MADDIVRWITVNGAHIPIKEGQSVDEAVKERQINHSKEEVKKKNVEDKKTDIQKHKQAQLEIIQKHNPKDSSINAQATWVESVKDIQTWKEAMDDEDFNGEDVCPDFTWKDILKAEKNGYVMVYSSKPIGQGSFVTPSRMLAVSYGNKNPYSKKVSLDEVAWIDLSEGQYANIHKN